MNKQTSILLSEAVGAITFSVCTSSVTYYYAKNSSLSAGTLGIGGEPLFYVLFASVFAGWVGMLIGGIIGIYEVTGRSNKIRTGGIGLVCGIFTFLTLSSFFKLNKGITIVFTLILFVIVLGYSGLFTLMTMYIANRANRANLSSFGNIILVLMSILLTLTTPISIAYLGYTQTGNVRDSYEIFLTSAIFIIIPMLVLWAIMSAFSRK